MSNHETCSKCGRGIPAGQSHLVDNELLCPDCLERYAVRCAHCGVYVMADDNAGSDIHPLCDRCYDEHYTTCERCGTLLRYSSACYAPDDEDEEYPYCDSCSYLLSHGTIHDYYYKPEPKFYGTGPRYFGVELEIDGAGENHDRAGQLMEIANTARDLAYCKHDGSLDCGFEIVTHPMTLEYHMQTMPWEAICEEAVEMGYTSHMAGTCGLHVHVSRKAFGQTEAEQDLVIARILYFVEHHWEELLKFSRRTRRQLEQWAARYGYKEQPSEILEHAKTGRHQGRYTCINLTNYDTIEFRMFRGTLKYNTLIATLQLVDRICDVALYMSDDEVKNMAWSTFVTGCTQPELVQYLKERRLYVNEPVDADEEV